MQNAAPAKGEIKPCPDCGKTPRVIAGLYGGYYVLCDGHAETPIARTREEAIRLWNNSQYDT